MYLYVYGLASSFQMSQHSFFALHVRLQVSKVVITVCQILILHQNFLQTVYHAFSPGIFYLTHCCVFRHFIPSIIYAARGPFS